MKIRSRLNLSGRKIQLAGQILAKDCDVKLEPYFKKMLISKGHEVEDFFQVDEVEIDCYEKVSEGSGKKKTESGGKKEKKVLKSTVSHDFPNNTQVVSCEA